MSEEKQSNEVNLLELFNVLRKYMWLILVSPFVVAVLAYLWVVVVLSPVWEASAVLEMGRIWQPTGAAAGMAIYSPVSIEGAATALLRINNSKFSSPRAQINVTQVKNADLLDVKVRAESTEIAREQLQEFIANLQKAHSLLLISTTDRYLKQLELLKEGIQSRSAEIELLKNKLLANHNWNTYDANLSSNVLQAKSSELRDMMQRKLELEEQLSPLRTYNTRVLGEVSVSTGPVSPRKTLIVLVAMLLGLVGAVLAAFAHNAITSKSWQ